MQETERNRSNEPSVPAVLFDPGVRVDEAGNGVLATLVLESGAAGRLRAGLPLLQLVLEVGQALRAVRRAGSDKKPVSTLARSADENPDSPRPAVKAPIVRVAVPPDEDESEDLLSNSANAVVGIALRREASQVHVRGSASSGSSPGTRQVRAQVGKFENRDSHKEDASTEGQYHRSGRRWLERSSRTRRGAACP